MSEQGEDARRVDQETPAYNAFFDIMKETTDYAIKSVETSQQMVDKLLTAKSLAKAFEIQRAFARASYIDFVVEAHRIGQIYDDLAERRRTGPRAH